MAKAKEKGDALELAVKAIEEHILQLFPDYNEKTFRIEWKKRFKLDGATDEVDILVEIIRDLGDASRIVFECKNREDKADKNDVILLAVKTDDVGAEAGFLVAKSFTKDAKARVKKYPKITLITATDLLAEHVDEIPEALPIYSLGIPQVSLKIDIVGQEAANTINSIPKSDLVITIGLQRIPFNTWVEGMKQRTLENIIKKGSYPPGEHDAVGVETFRNVRINNFLVRSIQLRGEFKLKISVSPVISAFDVETRGRYIGFAPFHGAGIEARDFKITMVPSNP